MKKCAMIVAAACATVIGMCVSSCGGSGEEVRVFLPDSASVGEVVPEIKGDFAEYYRITPASYELDITDTLTSLTIEVKHVKGYGIPNSFSVTKVSDGDTAKVSPAYLELLDSEGAVIPGVKLVFDNDALAAEMIGTPIGAKTEMRFVTSDAVDAAALASSARNFRVVAGISSVPESSKIDMLLQDFTKQIATYNTKWHTAVPRSDNQYITYMIDRGTIQAAIEDCENAMPYMNGDQLAKYRVLRASIKAELLKEIQEKREQAKKEEIIAKRKAERAAKAEAKQ